MRRTKIVATIGPATRSPEMLRELLQAGVDVVRLNMSHGAHEQHAQVISDVRAISEEMGKPVAIMQDLSGPKIRTGRLKGGQPVDLEAGKRITITSSDVEGDAEVISCNYPYLAQEVKPGDQILIDDGAIGLRVEQARDGRVTCLIINGGALGEHKGINLPGVYLSLPSITEKDRIDLQFGLSHGIDYVALSFVRTALDCVKAKNLMEFLGGSVPLIAKIEKREALDNLDEILNASEALMVARGDLGVETSAESVPIHQKEIISKANAAEKLVITATQMLQSMITNPRPTRAETSDVANAILDGSDAVMLSGETAVGQYPIESVRTMDRIIRYTENSSVSSHHRGPIVRGVNKGSHGRAIAEAAKFAAEEMDARLIVVFSRSGQMARHISNLRPKQRIIALTFTQESYNRLAALWGVEPKQMEFYSASGQLLARSDELLVNSGIAEPGETIVVMAGRIDDASISSMMKLHRVGELSP